MTAVNSIHSIADDVLNLQGAFDPLNATMLGIRGHDHRLADVAESAQQDLRQRARSLAEHAEALIPTTTGEDAVTAGVTAQQARALVDRIDARMIEYSITDFTYVGPAANLLSLMPTTPLRDAERAESYLARLRAIPTYLDAVAARHRTGLTAGRVPVARLVDNAVAHLDRYLANPTNDPLLRPVPPEPASTFSATRDRLLDREVRPAFARYRDVLHDQIRAYGRSDAQPGIGWLPDGDAMYAGLMRVHTTTDHTPEHLHQTGLDIIDALRAEFSDAGTRAFGTADLAEIFRRLAALRWRDADELLTSARAAIARAEVALPQWFGALPQQRCQVRPVPDGEAPGAPFAYYYQPSLDGSRPGVYYANTYQVEQRNPYVSEVTAFHEGVPGHHLQLTLAIERTDLPVLRRLADLSVTIEGWALYTERLADEMGLYTDDVARIGMLAMESMRAGRLVVDTGLHAKGWTRAQAIQFLHENTSISPLDIESEVDRYIAYPGQALSYMVGRLEIQRLRRQTEHRLGPHFDIRAFHDLILRAGPLPLGVLDDLVSTWPGTTKPAHD